MDANKRPYRIVASRYGRIGDVCTYPELKTSALVNHNDILLLALQDDTWVVKDSYYMLVAVEVKGDLV